MAKVILFDLDGTLLPMDTEAFVKNYLKELAPRVAHIIDPNEFIQALLAGTDAMLKNLDATKTNEQVFEETFLSITKLAREDIWPTLDDFYEKVFPTFSHLCQPTNTAREILEEALSQGYRLAVATNPVFPKAAIYHRLTWARIDDIPFELVTVYEESIYTKPHKEYYQYICDKLNVHPQDCIMVGNDKQEDLSASQIGMKTFLVEGCVIDRGEPKYPIDDQGTLEQLLEKLKNNQGLFSKVAMK
ncbi:HAD family hydrolase [Evansella cellulosilytica]|uniref:HAD-superfamily hydrolase, subfamily IA, variant 1 n=1 Tax=Evansella cellulosilytica (strain ATCC 21833 / DSM 2522 / FERM P-1141 / JCM 9156 / N-4) TaxID=649639 RepID=E6TX15_EVAC2|nr:HAD family hydrolase [Evansella cellulosilytica]ADU31104.1 HAD-superfamily hydrolase, subfamily IA, variant 1 [Evansella cellulosilytica DSM 2522]